MFGRCTSKTGEVMVDQREPADTEVAQATPAEGADLASLLGLAVGVVVVAALYLARDVLVPIMLAVLLSFVLAPIVSVLRRTQMPRPLAVIIAVLLALGVIAALASVIGSQVSSLVSNVPTYAAAVQTKIARLRDTTVGRLPAAIDRLERQLDRVSASPVPPPRRGAAVGSATRPMQVEVRAPPQTPLQAVRSILGPVVGPLETTLIVLIVAIFILLQREDLRDRMIRLFGSKDLHRTTTAMDDAAGRLSRYFLAQLALNAGFGTAIATGLFLLDVPSPLLWGILAGLLRFVPYIGAFLAAIPPVVLAAATGPDWTVAIGVVLLFVIGESIWGYVIEPLVYGHSTGLSPAAVIIAAIFWTWLWGPVGLVLSTPLTLLLVVLGRHFDRLEFLDVLLGDRPALSPVETFYQRLLAGHHDDVLEQAELMLDDRPLTAYYDDVAVPGLRIAARDAARGVLRDGKLTRVRKLASALLADLAEHTDGVASVDGCAVQLTPAEPRPAKARRGAARVPPPAAPAGTILCIAGRGPFDGSAAAMLAQLLSRRGVDVRTVEHAAASRERVDELSLDGIKLVCVCALDTAGVPPWLRYMLRRLRARSGDTPILVMFWPGSDPQEREAVAADLYAASLAEAVTLGRLALIEHGADQPVAAIATA